MNDTEHSLHARAEVIAREFHAWYELLAPHHGWATQQNCQRDWENLPSSNQDLMVDTVAHLLDTGVIK